MPFQSMVSPSFHSHPKIKMLDGGAWLDSFYDHAKHTDFFPEDVAYLKELCEHHEKDEGEVEGVAGQENEVVGEYSGQEQAV